MITLPDLPFMPLLRSLAVQFERKSARERALMVVAGLAFLFFLVDALVLTPRQKQIQQLNAQIESEQAEIQRVNVQIRNLSTELAGRNSAEKQAQLEELKRIVAEADSLLSEDDGSSLRLSAMLDAMVRTTPRLKLVSIKTLPVLPLLPRGLHGPDGSKIKPAQPIIASNEPPDLPPMTVYQHPVEIVIKGNYLDLLPYMEKLRRYPKRLFWTNASLEVVKHPDSVLRLTITTLSEQRQTPLVPHGDKASAAAAPSATSQPAAAVPAPAPASPPAAAPAAPAASAAPAAKAAPASQAATPSRESKP